MKKGTVELCLSLFIRNVLIVPASPPSAEIRTPLLKPCVRSLQEASQSGDWHNQDPIADGTENVGVSPRKITRCQYFLVGSFRPTCFDNPISCSPLLPVDRPATVRLAQVSTVKLRSRSSLQSHNADIRTELPDLPNHLHQLPPPWQSNPPG